MLFGFFVILCCFLNLAVIIMYTTQSEVCRDLVGVEFNRLLTTTLGGLIVFNFKEVVRQPYPFSAILRLQL